MLNTDQNDLILSSQEIKYLIISGNILSQALSEVVSAVKPGINGSALDKIAEQSIRRQGGKPSFLNYGERDNLFPSTICLSINDEVVHGIPSGKTVKDGDLVSIDIGAEYKGIFSDMAKTVAVGDNISISQKQLLKTTRESLSIGIKYALAGNFTGDIGHQIEKYVLKNGFSVVKSLVGHGIGRAPHQDPPVPNYGSKKSGMKLVPGMAIAIEPMVNSGKSDVITSKDGWTVRTYDGKASAHFEHTVLITGSKPIIITKSKKG